MPVAPIGKINKSENTYKCKKLVFCFIPYQHCHKAEEKGKEHIKGKGDFVSVKHPPGNLRECTESKKS